MSKHGVTCHVLDTSSGRPAAGVTVRLERRDAAQNWLAVGRADTNADGRILAFDPALELVPGEYRMSFDTASYLARQSQPIFYPRVEVTFQVASSAEHYHIPLLLSPFGYSTYRGS